MRWHIPLMMALALTVGTAHARDPAPPMPDAERLFQRFSALAPSGHPEVLLYRGVMLHHGIGTPKDHRAAYQHFQRAAQAGLPLASFMVGGYLLGWHPKVVAAKPDEALGYLMTAAQAGYAEAQWQVANLLLEKGDVAGAMPWLERASRQGHDEAFFALFERRVDGRDGYVREGLGFMRLMLKRLQTPDPELNAFVDMMYAAATPEEREIADGIVNGWITGPTELTKKANFTSVDLLAVLARHEKPREQVAGD